MIVPRDVNNQHVSQSTIRGYGLTRADGRKKAADDPYQVESDAEAVSEPKRRPAEKLRWLGRSQR